MKTTSKMIQRKSQKARKKARKYGVKKKRVAYAPLSDLPKTGSVRLPTVLTLHPVSRSTWLAGVASGRYPKPIRLGPRTVAWRVEDIRKVLESVKK